MNGGSIVSVAEVVRRGTEMLDERKPGWWEKVNPVTLNIGSSDSCVLGQLYGSYWPGRQALIENKDDFGWSANHGFAASATYDDYGQRIDTLNSEWRAVIEERQREAKARERINSLKSTPERETADLHC